MNAKKTINKVQIQLVNVKARFQGWFWKDQVESMLGAISTLQLDGTMQRWAIAEKLYTCLHEFYLNISAKHVKLHRTRLKRQGH